MRTPYIQNENTQELATLAGFGSIDLLSSLGRMASNGTDVHPCTISAVR